MDVKQIHSMAQVDCAVWSRLALEAYPFWRHEFLLALEQSGAVSEQTGWEPAHFPGMDEDIMERLVGVKYVYQLSISLTSFG